MRSRGSTARDSTRRALLEAAATIFAEKGYHEATVRQIAKLARANIAAVKYHFGDKLGLYSEVLRKTVLSAGHELVPTIVDQDAPPERILQQLIHTLVGRIVGADRPDLRFRLIAHELARPTPALSRLVKEIIQPNYDRLRNLVGKMLDLAADDEQTCFCVLSIVGQVILYVRAGSFFGSLRPQLKLTPRRVERLANHIAAFSLAYLQSVTV